MLVLPRRILEGIIIIKKKKNIPDTLPPKASHLLIHTPNA
jgi:hypothetical protein